MKTIRFRNEKEQYCSENANHGFTVEMPFCNIIAKRAGQQAPHLGNGVAVELDIFKKKDLQPIHFNADLFGLSLNTGSMGFWMNNNENRARNFGRTYVFVSTTWRRAFQEAKDYVFSEIEKYENLIKERELALVDAEF